MAYEPHLEKEEGITLEDWLEVVSSTENVRINKEDYVATNSQ